MSKDTHTDIVRKALMAKLTYGEYSPGHRFVLRELWSDPEFEGMSQTPIREALLQLVAANILIGQRGFSVRVPIPTAEHLAEVRAIRSQLEMMAALQHLEDWDDESIAEVEEVHRSMMIAKENSDVKSQLRFNAIFHMRLCQVEKESYLKSMIQTLWAITGPSVGYLYAGGSSSVFTGIHPHQEIIQALRDKNSKLLGRALVRDLSSTGTLIIEALKQRLSPEALTLQPFKPMDLVRVRTREGRQIKNGQNP